MRTIPFKILFLLSISICVNISISQTIKVGGNYSSVVGVSTQNFKPSFGLAVSFSWNRVINKKLTFQPEIMYSEKGAEQKATVAFLGNIKIIANLKYLEVPLLFHYNFSDENTRTPFPFLFGGVSLGIVLQEESILLLNGMRIKLNTTDVRPFDPSLVIGSGFAFPFRSHAIKPEVRYSMGLYPIGSSRTSKARNSVFSFLIGYTF
jgi:hypothetical protein